MNSTIFTLRRRASTVGAVICAVAIGQGDALAYVLVPAQTVGQPTTQVAPQSPSSQDVAIPADQLDSLVAPIALYPDPLLAQTLAASTYPLEILQLQQWLAKNPGLKDKALADGVAKQPWDPSVQAMAALPDVVKQLADNIQWTTDLGNAFLAQEPDVMAAVQRMRQRAEGTGSLSSTPQQVVETRTVDSKEVIVIEPASPDVVYVPSYNPTVVYGAAPAYYPYPPIYYPPVGHWGSAALGFGAAYGSAATAARYGGTYRGQSFRDRGNMNRATGTTGRTFSGQRSGTVNPAGTVNRGAVGTSGMTNRSPGSIQRGNSGGNINRGNFSGSRGSFNGAYGGNRGSFNRGSFGGGNRGGFGGGGHRGGGGRRR
jgi:hypothetical protein